MVSPRRQSHHLGQCEISSYEVHDGNIADPMPNGPDENPPEPHIADVDPPASAQLHEGPLPEVVTAKRHLRSLQGDEGGGSQAQVLEDDTGRKWMVKARNNRQGPRICASELVAGLLGARLGAPVQPVAVCDVPADLAHGLKFADGTEWASGVAFASELIDAAASYVVSMTASNAGPLLRAVALDTWTAQYNGRQARGTRNPDGTYRVTAVDFGHAFGSGSWTEQSLQQAAPPMALHDPNGWCNGRTADEHDQVAAEIMGMTNDAIEAIVASVPGPWVTDAERVALAHYLTGRREATAELFRAKAIQMRGQP